MEVNDSFEAVDTNLLLQGLKLLAKLQTSAPVAVVKPTVSDANNGGREDPLLKPKLEESRKRRHDDSPTELDKKAKRRMMNRVSAQNARNRKKTYVENLERKLAEMEEEVCKLSAMVTIDSLYS